MSLTPDRDSPRFIFTDERLEAVNESGDDWIDYYPSKKEALFKASDQGRVTHLMFAPFTEGKASHRTSVPWPEPPPPPDQRVELAPAVTAALDPPASALVLGDPPNAETEEKLRRLLAAWLHRA